VTRVVAIILHPVAAPDAGPLTRAFASMRSRNAERQARGFAIAGAEVRIEEFEASGSPPFGARLREAMRSMPDAGVVVLGSGSIPLATGSDRRALVTAAATRSGVALANNRYSADVIAIPAGTDIGSLPDLAADNGLPRWLEEHGVAVRDLVRRGRLQFDLDSPLDGLIAAFQGRPVRRRGVVPEGLAERARETARRIRAVAADPSCELLVAGRTSANVLRWLETRTASRTRALVEERGMRTSRPGQRPPRSTLGLLLDDRGAGALGRVVAELGDAAVVDTRVLLAHRLGPDEDAWPATEDRYASDLLLPDAIGDPWLRELTLSARDAPVPVLLGGHSLVGPGLPILLGGARRTEAEPAGPIGMRR
jgi:CTP:molybdopterin cytidylyltransferase MocA